MPPLYATDTSAEAIQAVDDRGHGLDDLGAVRDEIDRLDGAIVDLIDARRRLALRAAHARAVRGPLLRDLSREAEVVRRATARARDLRLPEDPVRRVFWTLIELSHEAVGAERPEPIGSGERVGGSTEDAR